MGVTIGRKGLPPANDNNQSREVSPDGYRTNRNESKNHGSKTFRNLSEEDERRADEVFKRAIEGASIAFENQMALMREANEVLLGAWEANDPILLMNAIALCDKINLGVMKAAKIAKDIGWVEKNDSDGDLDRIRIFIRTEETDSASNS